MRKSFIAIGAGAFVVITSLLCMNPDGKMYKKQKQFNSVNEVLTQLESNKLKEIDSDGQVNETKEFEECLSKRKRLTFSEMNFKNIEIEKVEELTDKEKELILEDYRKVQERLHISNKPAQIEPVRVDIKGSYFKHGDDTSAAKEYKIDLVLVDEGEGMVIDYYVEHNIENVNDNSTEEGRKVNAED